VGVVRLSAGDLWETERPAPARAAERELGERAPHGSADRRAPRPGAHLAHVA
jgi:hypothetical protein